MFIVTNSLFIPLNVIMCKNMQIDYLTIQLI